VLDGAPLDFVIDGDDAFVATDAGSIVAQPRGGGVPRLVTMAYGAKGSREAIAQLFVAGSLQVLDGKGDVWIQAKDSRERKVVARGVSAILGVSARGVVFTMTEGETTVVATTPAFSDPPSAVTRVPAPKKLAPLDLQDPLIGLAGDDLVFAFADRGRTTNPSWWEVGLALWSLDGGPLRPFARSPSRVQSVAFAGGWLYWYETGWRGSAWGGGDGPCQLMSQKKGTRTARVVQDVSPPSGSYGCANGLRFVASPTAVFCLLTEEGVLLRQPAKGGATTVVASGLERVLGPKIDRQEVFWVDAAGTLHRAPAL
jgi:hypothetical protein